MSAPKSKPFVFSETVTPNDSTIIDPPYRGLWVNGAGTFYYDSPEGEENIPATTNGGLFPFEVSRVYSTGLTSGLTMNGGR